MPSGRGGSSWKYLWRIPSRGAGMVTVAILIGFTLAILLLLRDFGDSWALRKGEITIRIGSDEQTRIAEAIYQVRSTPGSMKDDSGVQ
jgi:hypothetical protein